MYIKTFKATTPSNRQRCITYRNNLSSEKPIRSLSFGLTKKSGHNNKGRITVYHRGGGVKRKYRKIDEKKSIVNNTATVIRLEYDPNRTAWIALICYKNGILTYIISPKNIKPGDIISSGINIQSKIGNSLPLKNILVGTIIHNIEDVPGKGGKLVRAAGSYAILISKNNKNYAMIRLSSGEVKLIPSNCMATVGTVSNIYHNNAVSGKAGHSRWMNKRPTVRGIAMNPVDHPHGGRTNGGRPSVTPWGRITKGQYTRKNKNKLILSRRYA
jgi:large subunit ribosomal protein L2